MLPCRRELIGRQSTGKYNSNSILLLQFCQEFDLTLTNTWFRQPDKYKATWKQPWSGEWCILDYITVWCKDMRDGQVSSMYEWCVMFYWPLSSPCENVTGDKEENEKFWVEISKWINVSQVVCAVRQHNTRKRQTPLQPSLGRCTMQL